MLNSFYKFLNVEDYLKENWKNSEEFQLKAMNKTIDKIGRLFSKYNIQKEYKGNMLSFKPIKKSDFRVKVKYIDDLMAGYGSHEPETGEIQLSKKDFQEDGLNAFATICHESIHELEDALVQHIDEYPANSYEHEYLSLISQNGTKEKAKMKAFNIEIETQPYLSSFGVGREWGSMVDIAKCLYMIQLSERSAYATSDAAYNYIFALQNGCDETTARQITYSSKEQVVDIMRERYSSKDLSYEEICQLFDKAILNLLKHESPTTKNDIEASLTYDLAVCFKIQMSKMEIDNERKFLLENECKKLVNPYAKKTLLRYAYEKEGKSFIDPKDGIRIGHLNIFNDYEFNNELPFSINNIDDLSEEVLLENPRLVVSAIFYGGGEKVFERIKEEDFQRWYFSDANNISDIDMRLLAEILDSPNRCIKDTQINEYSPEGRKIRREEYKQEYEKVSKSFVAKKSNFNILKNQYLIEKSKNESLFRKFTKSKKHKNSELDIER